MESEPNLAPLHDSVPPPPNENKDAHTWAMLCHISAFSGHIIPLGHIIGPLILWLVKKEESHFIDNHGKEAVNFQITLTLYSILCVIAIMTVVGACIGGPAVFILWILDLVCTIVAAVKASNGEPYRYPLSIRFIK